MSLLPVGFGSQGGGYTIERSLRFRSSASAYLSRTPASAGNRKTWTWSGWVKKANSGLSTFICADPASGYRATSFFTRSITDGRLTFEYYDGTTTYELTCAALLRDPSAWYHLIVAVDTTQATSTNRTKIYVNGVQQTLSGNYVPQNTDMDINNTVRHNLGRFQNANAGAGNYLDGYLTEVNFIDGQALDPSSFGEYNADTGVWQPKKYSGSYGTNGFYLPFSDNTTTTTLAADASGNGNDWTPNNISLTSGVTYDSMTDTPTPYADGGNYCTLNSAIRPYPSNTDVITNSNLTFSSSFASVSGSAWGTTVLTSGKWYFEGTLTTAGPSNNCIGFSNNTIAAGLGTYVADARTYGWFYQSSGQKTINSTTTSYGTSYTTGDVIGIALDIDSATIEFFKNGSSQGQLTGLSLSSGSSGWLPAVEGFNGTVWNTNFGQRPFAYTPPTGFKALHTGNLPDSTIVDGSEAFETILYTGTGASGNSQTVGFQPDWTWIKKRSGADSNILINSISGGDKYLISDSTGAEASGSGFTFDSNGFTPWGASGATNANGATFVAWNWKANGAGVSNTDGSITSTVSANPTAGFSIVTYTGTGSTGTVGHGLGVAPDMIIWKRRDSTSNWYVYHKDVTPKALLLESTSAAYTTTLFNGFVSGADTLTLGAQGFNISGASHLAYCFADVDGYSKFGSYTGNGSADGPFVYLGFRPAFVMVKRTDVANGWHIIDSARDASNVTKNILYADTSGAEITTSAEHDMLSNGFKPRITSERLNASGGTYIYMAFAESPFKVSLAR